MIEQFNDIPLRDRIIVALDLPKDKALEVADKLEADALWVKVGMTLYGEGGPDIIKTLTDKGFKVFLDLKFHDIPHQVEGAARSAAATGASMLTLHGIGGSEMMKAAVKGATEGAKEAGLDKPIVLAVTVLTSSDESSLKETGIDSTVDEQVERLAKLAKEAGVDGVVCSVNEAAKMRELFGPNAYVVTPGVRPVGSPSDDQRRVATPAEAFEAGASHVVMGRPITFGPDPREAFEAIVLEADSNFTRP